MYLLNTEGSEKVLEIENYRDFLTFIPLYGYKKSRILRQYLEYPGLFYSGKRPRGRVGLSYNELACDVLGTLEAVYIDAFGEVGGGDCTLTGDVGANYLSTVEVVD